MKSFDASNRPLCWRCRGRYTDNGSGECKACRTVSCSCGKTFIRTRVSSRCPSCRVSLEARKIGMREIAVAEAVFGI